jgi:hypothetical protein
MSKKKKEDKKSKLQKLAKKSVTNKSGLHYATKYTAPKRSYTVDPTTYTGGRGVTLESAGVSAERGGYHQFNYRPSLRAGTKKYWAKKKGQFGSRATIHEVI